MTWSFLIDENTSKRVVRKLANDNYTAEHVVTVLGQGADDFCDILPYARQHNHVIVTKNYKDFHHGVTHRGIIIAEDLHTPQSIKEGIDEIVDQYPTRQSFQNQIEWLGDWI